MEMQNFLFENWAEILMVIMIAITIFQRMKIDQLENNLKDMEYKKCRAEFNVDGVLSESTFLVDTIQMMSKELSVEQLLLIKDNLTREIIRLSEKEHVDHDALVEVDKYKTCRSFISEAIDGRK